METTKTSERQRCVACQAEIDREAEEERNRQYVGSSKPGVGLWSVGWGWRSDEFAMVVEPDDAEDEELAEAADAQARRLREGHLTQVVSGPRLWELAARFAALTASAEMEALMEEAQREHIPFPLLVMTAGERRG
jgi:hypothetical protein